MKYRVIKIEERHETPQSFIELQLVRVTKSSLEIRNTSRGTTVVSSQLPSQLQDMGAEKEEEIRITPEPKTEEDRVTLRMIESLIKFAPGLKKVLEGSPEELFTPPPPRSPQFGGIFSVSFPTTVAMPVGEYEDQRICIGDIVDVEVHLKEGE